jgi:hypothetical protein
LFSLSFSALSPPTPSHAIALLLPANPAAQTRLPKLLLLIHLSKSVPTTTALSPMYAKKLMLRAMFSS